MLALNASRRAAGRLAVQARSYSAHGHHESKEGHHEEHGHHDEHHDDHGHHETPLAPAESIVNKNTLTFAGIVAITAGYYYANESYKASNDNKSLVSLLSTPQTFQDAKDTYDQYRARVQKQTSVQEMLTYPGKKVTADNFVARDNEVLGRVWASGTNTQVNTIKDWQSLPERKSKESPFY